MRLAGPEDAPRIAACFHVAYGGTYPIERISSPLLLARSLEEGSIVFAVADHEEAGIVGAAALVPPPSGPSGDACHGAVLPEWRRLDLFGDLQLPLFDYARERKLRFLFGRCVTAHPYSQRCMQKLGLKPAGLTLAAAPSDLRFARIRDRLEQRESFLDVVKPLDGDPLRLPRAFPGRYREVLSAISRGLGLPLGASTARPGGTDLFARVLRDEDLSTVTLRLGPVGEVGAADLPAKVQELEDSRELAAIFAELPIEHGSAARAIEELRELGFSFAAFLPERAEDGSHLLRMQKPLVPVEPGPITIDFRGAKEIKDFVFGDLLSAAPATADRS